MPSFHHTHAHTHTHNSDTHTHNSDTHNSDTHNSDTHTQLRQVAAARLQAHAAHALSNGRDLCTRYQTMSTHYHLVTNGNKLSTTLLYTRSMQLLTRSTQYDLVPNSVSISSIPDRCTWYQIRSTWYDQIPDSVPLSSIPVYAIGTKPDLLGAKPNIFGTKPDSRFRYQSGSFSLVDVGSDVSACCFVLVQIFPLCTVDLVFLVAS